MVNFEEIYDKSVKVSRSLVEDIRFSRDLNLDSIKACSEQICNYLDTNTNILNLLQGVRDKNQYMFSHPADVAFISYVIGKWINLQWQELYQLVCAGMLHDIGKAKIRDKILNKSEKLTEAEMEIVRNHPTIGYHILSNLSTLEPEILSGVLSHHERQDGSGYPDGLSGDRISLFGRIIAIADTYDAITSTRSYCSRSSPFRAVEEIQTCSFHTLDPKICQVFINKMTDYYYGSHVRLSNELEGDIIYINPEERTKPLIRCENTYINLRKERDIEIVEIL